MIPSTIQIDFQLYQQVLILLEDLGNQTVSLEDVTDTCLLLREELASGFYLRSEEEERETSSSLTPDQQKALEKMKDFVMAKGEESIYFRLNGFAGVGKTFTITYFMKWLKENKVSFFAAAPTNKALRNLRKLAKNIDVDLSQNSGTVAQLLGQQPVINAENGNLDFVSKGKIKISDYQLIIVDEFSMISKKNFTDINDNINRGRNLVLFLGDGAQLPAVGESEPIITKSKLIKNGATLTKIVRYQGDIARVAEEIRSNKLYQQRIYPFYTTEDRTIIKLDKKLWLEEMRNAFDSCKFYENSDYARVLVWRNKTAESINNYIRSLIYGDKAETPYLEGDRLIAKKPVFRFNTHKKSEEDWSIVMNNSEECEVVGKAILKRDDRMNWDYWEVPVCTDEGTKLALRLLTPESEKDRQDLMQHFKEEKEWKSFYALDKEYDYMPYAYCLTTHRSQGSTIENVFIYATDMIGCPDKQRIQYTALTRSKKSAFVCVDFKN